MNKKLNKMHEWFIYLFHQRMDVNGYISCFECGRKLHVDKHSNTSAIYSHLLEKKRFPELAGNSENIEIVCIDCHTLYTLKPKSANKQYQKMLTLKQKYNV